MKRLDGFLHVIAVARVLDLCGVHQVSREDLKNLVFEGAEHAMKADDSWRVCTVVCKNGEGKKVTFERVPEALDWQFEVLIGCGTLEVSRSESGEMLSLAGAVRDDLRTVESLRSNGFSEPIVIAACTPARRWAGKHRPRWYRNH